MIKHNFLYKDEGRVKLILMLESIPDENDIEMVDLSITVYK